MKNRKAILILPRNCKSGGNIIAQKFMDEIPRSKLKEGNDRITKNIILVKVVK